MTWIDQADVFGRDAPVMEMFFFQHVAMFLCPVTCSQLGVSGMRLQEATHQGGLMSVFSNTVQL